MRSAKIKKALSLAKINRALEQKEISAILMADLKLKIRMKVKSDYLQKTIKMGVSNHFQF